MDHTAQNDCTPRSDPAEALRGIIADGAIRPVFQPIVDLHRGAIAGCESLSRAPEDRGFRHIGEVFDTAAAVDALWDLEAICRRVAFTAVDALDEDRLLFMNCSPNVLSDDRFVDHLMSSIKASRSLSPRRIVLEVTERAETPDMERIKACVDALKCAGFGIAIDDVGAGTSGLNRIMTLRPQWLKLDRELVDHIDGDPFKQNLIDFFVHFARVSGVRLVAEGIERREELATLIDLGVQYAQGMLLARPGELRQQLDPELREFMRRRSGVSARSRDAATGPTTLESVLRPATVCQASDLIEDAASQLRLKPDAQGLVVLDGRRFVGWCARETLLRSSEDRVGMTVGQVTNAGPPPAPPETPLAEVVRIAASRDEQDMLDPMVIADPDCVHGILTVRDLLRAGAMIALQSPTRQSPLTGLPGRVESDRYLAEMIRDSEPADVAFIDLRHFHMYNRTFGYEMGDLILRILAGQLIDFAGAGEDGFVGHLGDDRFIVIKSRGGLRADAEQLIVDFEKATERFVRYAIAEGGDRWGDADVAPIGLRVTIIPNAGAHAVDGRDLHFLAWRLRDGGHEVAIGASRIISERRSAGRANLRQSA